MSIVDSNTEKRFPWGQVIRQFNIDFDGEVMAVTKYHPWLTQDSNALTGQPNMNSVEFHSAEMHQSAASIEYLVLTWIARKNLGMNQHALVNGVAKALGVVRFETLECAAPSDEYVRGYMARKENDPFADCPYAASEKVAQWRAGWKESDRRLAAA